MIKPLLRVIPTYSGNVKLSCTLSDYVKSDIGEYVDDPYDTYDCYVRDATLSPLSHTIYDKQIQANLLSSDYSFDLKKYYIYYSDTFFENGFSFSNADVSQIDELNPIYDRNVDLEYGCSRVSMQKYGHQFEMFAPIYVDDPDDLPMSFYIIVGIKSSYKDIKKKIRVNIMRDHDNKRNYLSHYLDNYKKYLDENFIYMSKYERYGNVYGLDLSHGGQTSSIDSTIGSLFMKLNTMNSFDYCVGSSYKRNKMCMKQVLPLSFKFDLDNIMDNTQSHLYKGSIVTISGHYATSDGDSIPFYDWSCNYDDLKEQVMFMNTNTGAMEYSAGKVENIMDDSYPSLHEARILEYKYSSKLSRMYSRWKLRASDDDHPYYTNLSFAFSKNQNSSFIYGQFPIKTSTIPAIATAVANTDSIASDYSLVFPLGSDISKYESEDYKYIVKDYENMFNNYGMSWFDVLSLDDDIMRDGVWGDVRNDECYYKGILHSFSNIYKKIGSSKEKIDKFGVFVIANPNIVSKREAGDMHRANWILKTSTYTKISVNCHANKNIIDDMVYVNGDERRAICEAFTSISPSEYEKNSEISQNEAYIRLVTEKTSKEEYTYTTYTDDGKEIDHIIVNTAYNPRYVNPRDLGFTISDIDDWSDYSDVKEAIDKAIRRVNNAKSIDKWCEKNGVDMSYDKASFTLATNRLLSKEDLYQLSTNLTPDMMRKYVSYSFELLPIHNMSLLVSSYMLEDDQENVKHWSYMTIGGKYSYVDRKYGVKCHISELDNFDPINPNETLYDNYVCDNIGKRLVYAPGYVSSLSDILTLESCRDYIIEKSDLAIYADSTYIDEKNKFVYLDYNNKKYKYYWDEYSDSTYWQDPFIKQIYVSSQQDPTPTHDVGFTYIENGDVGVSYSYIVFSPENLVDKNYGFSIYRKSEFFNNKHIKRFKYEFDDKEILNAKIRKDISDIIANGNSEGWSLDDFDINMEDSTAYRYKKAVTLLYEIFLDTIEEELMKAPRYMFMPVMFGNSKVYAENVFVKKDANASFNGNKIKTSELDHDDDMIWVDSYNLRRLMLKYNADFDSAMSTMKIKKARLLGKDHLYWWYNELCRNYDYEYPEWRETGWFDHVYIRTKRFTKDDKGKLMFCDTYTKLGDMEWMQPDVDETTNIDKNSLRVFNIFYDMLEVSKKSGLWKFRKSEKYSFLNDLALELMIDIDVVRLDNDMMEKMMRLEDMSSFYRDIYLYRIEKEEEWERTMMKSETPRVDYSSDGGVNELIGHSLIPLFNRIYEQNKEETEIYAHYLLNDISEVEVEDNKGKLYYRYSSNDVDWLIELTDDSIKTLSSEYGDLIKIDGNHYWQPTLLDWMMTKVTGKDLSMPFENSLAKFLYYKYDGTKISIIDDNDDLEYGIENFNTCKYNGVNYGYWLLRADFDNTTNSMNIVSQYNAADEGEAPNYLYDNKIKWLKYVNGHDITTDEIFGRRYLSLVYRQLIPFLKSQPYDLFNNISTVVYPTKVVQKMRFEQSLDTTTLNKYDQPNELCMSIRDKNTFVEFQRYFEHISPIIQKTNTIRGQWLMKFKDVKDKSNTIVRTGKYPSIGDATIWKTDLSIASRNSVPVYVPSLDDFVRDYNNRKLNEDGSEYRVQTLEQKYFNDSTIVYCDPMLEFTSKKLISQDKIDEVQSDDNVYNVWRMLLKGTLVDNMTRQQLLFLYNRYESSVVVDPVKLNANKTSKLYRVHYKYVLI